MSTNLSDTDRAALNFPHGEKASDQ